MSHLEAALPGEAVQDVKLGVDALDLSVRALAALASVQDVAQHHGNRFRGVE